jgi:hypothetical protein
MIKRKKKKKKIKKKKKKNGGKKKKTRGKKRKRRKGPPPKKSAYTYFITSERPKFVEKNPDADFGEISKKMGAHWKSLDETQKAPWTKLAEEDKTRFDNDLKNWDEKSQDSSEHPKKRARKAKDPNAPKLPPNSYIIFQKEQREKIKEDNPDASGKEINQLIGKAWKNLTEDEKKPYHEKYQTSRDEYKVVKAEYDKKKKEETDAKSTEDVKMKDVDETKSEEKE